MKLGSTAETFFDTERYFFDSATCALDVLQEAHPNNQMIQMIACPMELGSEGMSAMMSFVTGMVSSATNFTKKEYRWFMSKMPSLGGNRSRRERAVKDK
mmetsp:Transcript_41063/g.89716  ORF Transcript_41063/g.89716 Transcript_41063/m.89716 type:complete len:99 (-) Transcript_41063:8-304(-)